MASVKLIEPKKKPRYYQLTANVLVNGKIERRYGRFDFDPTQIKNARAHNAAANSAAAEFERQEQEKADKEAGNAGKTFCGRCAGVHSFKPFQNGTFHSIERRL